MTGTCSSCHNGSIAEGKPAGHIPTTAQCSDCHRTTAWSPATFNHAGVTGNCASCHNGTTATGKGSAHIASTSNCAACHTIGAWSPARTVDHNEVTGT
ncbi:MAG: cytochrome C, partial [Porphyrobacter sp.]|nr:cytochrome C [Porphyrobacter sp.]